MAKPPKRQSVAAEVQRRGSRKAHACRRLWDSLEFARQHDDHGQ